jgi:pimeloyl-ACP methyl ester carboxylesterase
MSKAPLVALLAVIALVGLGFGGRAYATRAMSSRAVAPKTLGASTPASVGIPFSRVAIETGNRTLIGWWVRARADSGKVPPALLFLHGNRSSISDYVGMQRFLYKQGISSLVFDYSGFGASGGSPTLTNAIQDAASVSKVFADSAGAAARKVAMGSALGATVLLQAIDSIQPRVNGVIIEGVAASVREAAVRDGRLPKLVAPLVVDLADNVTAARNVKVPLLAVHSYADQRFPIEDAQRVVQAVPAQYSLVRHWRKGHSALLSSTRPCDWDPVLRFIRTGALPAAKVDSVDQCAVQAQLAAAQKAMVMPAGSTSVAAPATRTPVPATKTAGTATKTPAASAMKSPTTKTTTKTAAPVTTSTKATSTKTTSTKSTSTKTKAPSKNTSKTPTTTKRP